MDGEMAKKTFELQNNIETVSNVDEIYKYSRQQQQEILARKPWQKEYDCIFLFRVSIVFIYILFILNVCSLEVLFVMV